MKSNCRHILILMAVLLLPMLGCDPQRDAVRAFERQGLLLLQPARDYVVPGGILISTGRDIVYVDPLRKMDTVMGSFDPDLKFDRSQSTTLDLALGLIGQEVKIPSGLHIQGSQQVRLKQLDIDREAITHEELNATLADEAVNKFVRSEVSRTRVFVVQEVYLFRSLTLTGASSADLRPCTVQNNAYPEEAQSSSSGRFQSDGSAVRGDHRSPPRGKVGIASVELCRSGPSEISVIAEKPVPFAVRPVEVSLAKDGSLSLNLAASGALARDLEGSMLRAIH